MVERGEVLWSPRDPAPALSGFRAHLQRQHGVSFGSYGELWAWSVANLASFWAAVWDHFEVIGTRTERVLEGDLPAARWFGDASVNYAQNALARADPGAAVTALSQDRDPVRLDRQALIDLVGGVRTGLVRLGVGRGDRVAGYLPNGVEALGCFLASASLGAVWSSCAPEFGTRAVLDRFGQIRPRVLVAVDGYTYGDRRIDRTREVAELAGGLPGVETVVVPRMRERPTLAGATSWEELVAHPGPLDFELVPFDHPLYILYSSGTTGPPKAIVHGHGGILLEHLKALCLHADIRPGDRFFWFSTTGWMMWNFLVSGLLAGATVLAFDGSPTYPGPTALWEMAASERLTYFGTSATFITACRRAGLRPGSDCDLTALRTVGSTGAPLPAAGYRWVYEAVKSDVVLSSISGGTDVCTAFVGGSPELPVRAGEISCRYLGAAVEAFDSDGLPVVGRQGELVVTAPMPSMPVGLWGDADGSRYRDTYFGTYPGVWRHGDWVTIFEDGACVITGRSDATLNRAGVRIGTAELYAVVESVPGVADSLVIHLEDPEGGPGRLMLFVVTDAGHPFDEALAGRIREALRSELSPRHVPDSIQAVPEIPKTLSGKKLEVPVKRILSGEPASAVLEPGALANPEALQVFLNGPGTDGLDTLGR